MRIIEVADNEALYSCLIRSCAEKSLIIFGSGEVARLFYESFSDIIATAPVIRVIKTQPQYGETFYGIGIEPFFELKKMDTSQSLLVVTAHDRFHYEILQTLKLVYEGNVILIKDSFLTEMKAYVNQRLVEKNKISLCYADIPNFGDLLNEDIMKKVFGYSVRHEDLCYANMTAIGSLLDGLFIDPSIPSYNTADYTLNIWGSGFSYYSELSNKKVIRRDVDIKCVRGELSKRKLEKYYDKTIACAVGDPGLLVKKWVSIDRIDKKYSIGIIPHYKEPALKIVSDMYDNYKNSIVINLRNSTDLILKQISECEAIISSSLHGVVIADALGIPNVLVKISDIPLTDGFRYDDYYSAYGLVNKQIDLRTHELPSIAQIKENYLVLMADVERIIEDLMLAFPWGKESV